MADYEFDESGMPVGFQPASAPSPVDQLQFDESGMPVGFQPAPKADPLTDRYKLQTDIATGSTTGADSYEKARAAYAAGQLAKFDADIGAQHGGAAVLGDDAMRPGDLIDAIPHDKLMASDRYRQVYGAALPVLGEDKAQAYAKDTIANDAHSIPYLRDSIFSDLMAAPKDTAFEYHYGQAPDVPKAPDAASGMTYVEGDPGLAQQPALDQFGNAPAIAGANIESAAWKYGAKGPLLIGAAGGMAVDAVRSLFGNDTTAAQDFFFQHITPIDEKIKQIEAEKPKATGTAEQIVDKVSGMFVPLVMAAATRNPEILEANGSELFAMPVWQAAWNSAAAAIRQGLLPAETMALPGAIDAAQQVAEKGGGTAESVVASLSELGKGTAQFSAPMAAGGTIAAKAATGGAAMAAIGTAGRIAAGQPTDFSDVASDAIIGAFMGQMHQDPESVPAAVRPKAEEAVAAAGDDPAAKARVAYVMDGLQQGKPPLWAAAEFNVIVKTGLSRDEAAFQRWNDQQAARQVVETPEAETATPEARATTEAAQALVGESETGSPEAPIWPDFQQRLEASRARAAAPDAAEAIPEETSNARMEEPQPSPVERTEPHAVPPNVEEGAARPLDLTAEQPPAAEELPKGQPTGKMFAQGKRAQAIQLDDGTWMVRQRVAGNWQAWEPRDTFDASGAFGYRPFQPPSGQVNLPGGRVKVGEARAKEPTPEPGPTTALEALARGGGLNRAAWQREGIDPEEFSRRYGTKWLFRVEGGLTPDQARESLQESGFLPRDPENAPPTVTDNDAIDVVMRGLAGDHTYSIADAAEHDKMLQARFENQLAHEEPDVADPDYPEAHDLVKTAEQAHDAGVPWHEMEPTEGEPFEEYMARVHRAIAEQEAQHGTDTGPEAENRVEGVPGETPFRLAAQEAPAERPAAPRAQQGGLFGAPTGREVTEAAARARDLELRGGDRAAVPMRAGEGELFAGPRPEQAEIPRAEPVPAPTADDEIPFDRAHQEIPKSQRGPEHFHSIGKLVSEAYSKLGPNAPRVTILRNADRAPLELRQRLDAADPSGNWRNARGLITNKGRVFLFTDNIESVGRGVVTFTHEVVGHYGVDRILGADGWNRVTQEISRIRADTSVGSLEFRGVIGDVERRYPGASEKTFAREVVAVAAERGMRNGFMADVIASVRDFVRKIFPSLKFSEGDILHLLTRSEDLLREKGGKPESTRLPTGQETAFSRPSENVAPHSDLTGDGEPQKTIRTPIGTLHVETKSGETRSGPGWTRVMRHDYGYIEGVPGRDGGSMDTIIGEGARDPSRPVFVIDQKSETGGFDEHKVLVGFKNQRDAERAYLSEYPRGWDRMGPVRQFSAAEFRDWARTTGREEAQVGKVHADVPRVTLRAQQPDAVAMHAVTSRGMPTRANHEGQPLERLGLPGVSRSLTMRTSFRDAQGGGEGTHGAVLRNLYDVNTDGRGLFDRARENLEARGETLDEPHMANEFERLVVAGGFDGYRTADGRAVVLGAKVPLAEHIHGRTIPEGAAQPGIGRNAAPAAPLAGRNVARNAPSEREDQAGARQAESNARAGESAEQGAGVRVPGRPPGQAAREGLDEDRSIRNAATEAVRAARGAEPVEKIGGRTANEIEVDARTALAKNPNLGREIAHEVANNPRNISDTEAAVLAIDRQRIAQEHDSARDRTAQAIDAKDEVGEAQARAAMKLAEDARELNEKATTHAGTEWSNSGRARLLSVQKDESLVSLLTDFKVRAGREATPAERGNLERIADEIKETKSDVASPGRKRVPKDTAAAARSEFDKLVEQYHRIPKDELMTKECYL